MDTLAHVWQGAVDGFSGILSDRDSAPSGADPPALWTTLSPHSHISAAATTAASAIVTDDPSSQRRQERPGSAHDRPPFSPPGSGKMRGLAENIEAYGERGRRVSSIQEPMPRASRTPQSHEVSSVLVKAMFGTRQLLQVQTCAEM